MAETASPELHISKAPAKESLRPNNDSRVSRLLSKVKKRTKGPVSDPIAALGDIAEFGKDPPRLKGSLVNREKENPKPKLKSTFVKREPATVQETPVLKGTLIKHFRERGPEQKTPEDTEKRISDHVLYLNETVAPLSKEHGGFAIVLGGASPLSTPEEGYTLNTSRLARDPQNIYRLDPKLRIKSFARPWNTGADLNAFMQEVPNERFKFYLSLKLDTPQKVTNAQEMFGRLLTAAKENKISLSSKSEEHTYDSCDLYTWDRKKLEDVIKTLYAQYPDIWNTTHHFFQAPIDGIDPMHIGWVQEPVGGKNGSHSNRMRILGKEIDSGGGIVDAEKYVQACQKASVRPEAPWLIAA